MPAAQAVKAGIPAAAARLAAFRSHFRLISPTTTPRTRTTSLFTLAIETSSKLASVALLPDGEAAVQQHLDPLVGSARTLAPAIERLLADRNLRPDRLQLIAVSTGPGSFTGLRVGIAAMQGLAVATGLRIVPVSALDALARAGRDSTGRVAAWMDAQRGQVFAALYGADGQPLRTPSALSPVETLEAWGAEVRSPQPVRFIGGGAVRYAELIRAELGVTAAIADSPPLAGIIGLMAAEHPSQAVSPHAVIPIYIRRPDAELARKRNLVIERLTSEADLDAVASMEAACFTNPWTREMLAGELARNPFARVYVLRLPGSPVAAFCACWLVVDELHINTIAVGPDYRRQGLATALMRHILGEVAREGIRRATLEVRQSNEAARQLYEHLGFTVAAVRPGYYTQPVEDALIMWRETPPTAGSG